MISLSHKSSSFENFWWRHCVWFVVWASLPIKNYGHAYNLKIAWKAFLKTFFFGEHLRLCPWPLASSIPVPGLERVCPRKGCPWPRIFLCPWPWALCHRLHLCFTLSLYFWMSSWKVVNTKFIVFGLTRSESEPEFTVSEADVVSTKPLIGKPIFDSIS